MPKSRIAFRSQEISVLQQILSKYKQDQKPQINKIVKQFNATCCKQLPNFTKKSVKAIKNKLAQKLNIRKHFWSPEINQLMMNCIICGMQWKQISELKQFLQHKLESKQIKRKFQCAMRYKFKILYRKVYNEQAPNISDTVYKWLIQHQKLEEFENNEVLTLFEKQTILNNIKLFKQTLVQQDMNIRSSQVKGKLFNLVHQNTCLQTLVRSIVKLNSHKLGKLQSPRPISICQLFNDNEVTRSFSSLVNLQEPICPHYQQIHSELFFSDQLNSQFIYQQNGMNNTEFGQQLDQIQNQENLFMQRF